MMNPDPPGPYTSMRCSARSAALLSPARLRLRSMMSFGTPALRARVITDLSLAFVSGLSPPALALHAPPVWRTRAVAWAGYR